MITDFHLMDHRKLQHPGAIAQCKKFVSDNCDFSAEKCWWSHEKKKEIKKTQIDCFICGEIFKSIRDIMVHKKTTHKTVVKPCKMFQQNKCRFKSESCWFVHEQENGKNEKPTEETDDQSVFQRKEQNPKPPFKNQKQKKE